MVGRVGRGRGEEGGGERGEGGERGKGGGRGNRGEEEKRGKREREEEVIITINNGTQNPFSNQPY